MTTRVVRAKNPSMFLEELDYSYPDELVGTEPQGQFRAMHWSQGKLSELDKASLLALFQPGDVLVINDTKVLKRRIFTEEGLEILFLKNLQDNDWQVLFPARKIKVGEEIRITDQVSVQLIEKGLPQTVRASEQLTDGFFESVGELALPPYIQKARDHRHNIESDNQWYQTAWAKTPGSFAAPTASLHFSQKDLQELKDKGVDVVEITLHVGLGTFLPIKVNQLSEHKMHSEWCFIASSAVDKINSARKVWALGTTVTRALESMQHSKLQKNKQGDYFGDTDIFITPGYSYQVVDNLLTNFHQPQSTLLALVAAYAGLDEVKNAYKWAIDKEFKLFSYGHLSVWQKN